MICLPNALATLGLQATDTDSLMDANVIEESSKVIRQPLGGILDSIVGLVGAAIA
jgi:hypothetical protein